MVGTPNVTIRCRPSFNYNAILPTVESGANHIRYDGPGIIVSKLLLLAILAKKLKLLNRTIIRYIIKSDLE